MRNYLILIIVLIFVSNVRGQNYVIEKDSLLNVRDFKMELAFEKDDMPVSAGVTFIESEPLPNALRNVFDRLYIDNIGIEAYRQNLDELLGRIAVKENDIFNLGLPNIKNDTVNIKSFVPEQGRLISHKLTEKSSATLSFFINVTASSERIYEFYISDISRAILKYKQIDKELLKKLVTNIDSEENLSNYYLITGVTVTEIFRKQFDKKKRKIKASNFPISGVALSFGGTFFVSDENFEREYKLGLTTLRLDIVKRGVDALLD
jgi:hypothetical protein